ncbi:type-2 ice-structuring protein-like [Entelurus aequoreus]|uniref:type-2 ice-structuring protein-like n=1 Tax=Entelurus aequoreus TaxID=161455 RepID=UPI002B1DB42F|nr:type-2 ice-structuring protein-like [Entelurus aequoreus]
MRPSTTATLAASLLCAAMALTAVDGQILANSTCPGNWTASGNRCFHLLPNTMIWSTAQKHCQNMGANLASVHNQSDVDLIQHLAGNQTAVWIGGSSCQQTNVWFWWDGTKMDFRNWCPGHPKEDKAEGCCLYASVKDGNCWEEKACDNFLPSACVMKPT